MNEAASPELAKTSFSNSGASPELTSGISSADSNVEMTWQILGGDIANQLLIALKQRCHKDDLGTDPETLTTQLRLHLHQGIGYDPSTDDVCRLAIH